MATKTDFSQDITEYCVKLAEEWFREQCKRQHTEFYLWYQEGGKNLPLGEMSYPVIAADRPGPNWILASVERVSPAKTQVQVQWWLREVIGMLPILGTRED